LSPSSSSHSADGNGNTLNTVINCKDHTANEAKNQGVILLKTSDSVIVEISSESYEKFNLILMMLESVVIQEPVPVLVSSKDLFQVLEFAKIDHCKLEIGYNPLEVYFSPEILAFFDFASTEEVLSVCNAANYLNYPFLLELSSKILATRLEKCPEAELAKIFKDVKVAEEDHREIIRKEYDWMGE